MLLHFLNIILILSFQFSFPSAFTEHFVRYDGIFLCSLTKLKKKHYPNVECADIFNGFHIINEIKRSNKKNSFKFLNHICIDLTTQQIIFFSPLVQNSASCQCCCCNCCGWRLIQYYNSFMSQATWSSMCDSKISIFDS